MTNPKTHPVGAFQTIIRSTLRFPSPKHYFSCDIPTQAAIVTFYFISFPRHCFSRCREMDIMEKIEKMERATWPAVWKGWRRKCPNCGKGQLLSGYLKVGKSCTVCRQEFHHHKADDGPAYLTILIVGHLMAPLLHVAFVTFRPEPLVLFAFFAVGCVALSLYLLPRLKGAIVGFQWARSMHGF